MELLVTFIAIILGVWYWKFIHRHPKKFPPGPRCPIPLFGDAYVLGSDLNEGFKLWHEKYGKVCGFWLAAKRAVFIADFDLLQDSLNKSELANRQIVEIGGTYLKYVCNIYVL